MGVKNSKHSSSYSYDSFSTDNVPYGRPYKTAYTNFEISNLTFRLKFF